MLLCGELPEFSMALFPQPTLSSCPQEFVGSLVRAKKVYTSEEREARERR